jgi:phage tail protein X
MAITGYELVTVESEYRTVDLIVWNRYRLRTFGIVERLLDDNPHLAKVHRFGPFLPVGTQLRIPIDPSVLAGSPQPQDRIVLIGATRTS